MDKPTSPGAPEPCRDQELSAPIAQRGIIASVWTNHVSLLFGEFLLAGIVLTLGTRFWLERELSLPATALLAVFMAGGPLLVRTVGSLLAPRWPVVSVQILLGGILSVLIYAALRGYLYGAVSRSTFAEFTAVFVSSRLIVGMLNGELWQRQALGGAELLRWMSVTAATLWIHQRLLFNGSVGAGDAYWYTIMVADFVTQWREGIFPVFVGQSEFAFNGAINPLRFAPGLQHLAGVVDLFTLRSLPFHGLLNLTLVASFVGGALSCYGCLRAIHPKAAWLAAVFALLYSAAPGVLALAYVGDLFMSVTTLPFVPLVFYGAWRTLVKPERFGLALMVAAAAALWFCHPPIALWATAIAAVTQLFRLSRDARFVRTWLDWAAAAALFGLLSCYSFVSVLTLKIPAYPAFRPVILEDLKASFRASLDPINRNLSSLSDYQLGWALWGALAAGLLTCAFVRPRRPSLAFLASAVFVLAFLAPIPWVLDKLWMLMPQAAVDITFMWPMQRLYVVLAAISAFAGFLTLGALSTKNRLVGAATLLIAIGAAQWSGREVLKFHHRAEKSTTGSTASKHSILPQNRILTRYSYNPFRSTPPYFSHGFVDPEMQNSLLEPGSWKEIGSNLAVLEQGKPADLVLSKGELTFTRPDLTVPTMVMTPTVQLAPGKRYALKIEFHHPEFNGALTLRGPSLSRTYYLPDSGYGPSTATPSRAFGALPGRPGTITLWTDQTTPETVSLTFFFSGPGPEQKIDSFGRYTFFEINPAELPVRMTRWSPYLADVTVPVGALLETPRIFMQGYTAKVNGQNVPVTKSPSGLVAFEVPSGNSRVELTYPGSWALRLAYFLSLAAWVGLIGIAIRRQFGKSAMR